MVKRFRLNVSAHHPLFVELTMCPQQTQSTEKETKRMSERLEKKQTSYSIEAMQNIFVWSHERSEIQ